MDIVPLIQKLANIFVYQPKTIFLKKCKGKGQGPPNKGGIFKCLGGAGVDFDLVQNFINSPISMYYSQNSVIRKKRFEILTKNHRLFAPSFWNFDF